MWQTSEQKKKLKSSWQRQLYFKKCMKKEKCVGEYHVTYMVHLLPAEKPPYICVYVTAYHQLTPAKKVTDDTDNSLQPE